MDSSEKKKLKDEETQVGHQPSEVDRIEIVTRAICDLVDGEEGSFSTGQLSFSGYSTRGGSNTRFQQAYLIGKPDSLQQSKIDGLTRSFDQNN